MSPITETRNEQESVLSEEELQRFEEEGFLTFPGLMKPDMIADLKSATDSYMDDWQAKAGRPCAVRYQPFSRLASEPIIIEKVQALMGSKFAMHHVHVARHDAGNGGVHWHQDYEQHPQTNRSHLMVHVFMYLDGLNGTVGDLLVLPGSHKTVVDRRAIRILGHADLPGSLTVDNVPPGTVIIVHSALWHGRRPKPGGDEKPRYFIDISYCQEGVQWPNTPTWIDEPSQAIEKGWLHPDWEFVFERDMFYNRQVIADEMDGLSGSVALALAESRKESV